MRIVSLLSFSLFTSAAIAQCDGDRYFNQIFNDFYVTSDIVYGNNLDWTEASTDLLVDVYRPYGEDQTFERPLVIIVHGGSFLGGSKDGEDVVPIAGDLAKMGYVTASISYRLGVDPLGALFNGETEFSRTVIRAYHDAKAAVRFFRKSVAEENNPYGINPNQIYMLGVSAGGFVALHVAYLNSESEIPAVIDQSLPGLGGGLEGNSGNAGYSAEIAGLVNIAGAMGDVAWMEGETTPLLSFHGDVDGTVPYESGSPLGGIVPITVFGSAPIHAEADAQGILNCFVPHPGADHVPHVSNAAYYDTTRAISANFLGHLVCPTIPLDCEYREVTLDIDEATLAALTAFPNPVRERLTLTKPGLTAAFIEVYDLNGRLVIDERMVGEQHHLNVGHLNSGWYVLRLISEGSSETLKFIVE